MKNLLGVERQVIHRAAVDLHPAVNDGLGAIVIAARDRYWHLGHLASSLCSADRFCGAAERAGELIRRSLPSSFAPVKRRRALGGSSCSACCPKNWTIDSARMEKPMISTVIGGAMLPHAPQFFTMPETEDKKVVERVREVAADIGRKLRALNPDLWIIFSNDHAEQFFHTTAPPFTVHV